MIKVGTGCQYALVLHRNLHWAGQILGLGRIRLAGYGLDTAVSSVCEI